MLLSRSWLKLWLTGNTALPYIADDGDDKGEDGISFCTYRLLREITQGYLAKAP